MALGIVVFGRGLSSPRGLWRCGPALGPQFTEDRRELGAGGGNMQGVPRVVHASQFTGPKFDRPSGEPLCRMQSAVSLHGLALSIA
jgi:hypothetical protein